MKNIKSIKSITLAIFLGGILVISLNSCSSSQTAYGYDDGIYGSYGNEKEVVMVKVIIIKTISPKKVVFTTLKRMIFL